MTAVVIATTGLCLHVGFLPNQVGRDLGELSKSGFQVLDDLGGQHVGVGEVGAECDPWRLSKG